MVQVTETVTESLRYSRSLAGSGSVTSVSDGLGYNAQHANVSTGFVTTLTVGLGIAKTDTALWYKITRATDGLGLQETHATKLTYIPTQTEGLGFDPNVIWVWPGSLTEGLGVSPTSTAAIGRRVVEGLGLAPVLTPKLTYGLTATEGLRFTDSLGRFLGGEVIEGLAYTPAASARMRFPLTLADSLITSASVTGRLLFRVTATEGLGLDDVDAIRMIFKPGLTEGLELSAAYIAPDGSVTTWAINTRTGAVTEYTNYDFNSFAKFGNKYLGASSDGLYELLGDDDDGTDIIAKMKTGFAQFAGSHLCHFKAIYLGVRNGGTYYLRIETAEGTETTYRVIAEDMRTTRVQVGKGLRARYFAFELESLGQDFDLESIEFVPLVVQRRR